MPDHMDIVSDQSHASLVLIHVSFLLVRHPKVMEKLKMEIQSTFAQRTDMRRSDLRSMTYLQNVLKESRSAILYDRVSLTFGEALRLYPSVPVNTRTAVRNTFLPVGGGPDLQSPVFIPKGAAVAYSVYAMHRRPDFYGMDAELYRPERWDEQMPIKGDPINASWGYLPFNGGPRVCLGMDFGLTEAAYTVVRLLHEFPDLSLPVGEKIELLGVEKQTMTLVMSSTDGCRVNLGA